MEPRKGASEFTKAANAKLLAELPFEDERDFEEAMRGMIAPLSTEAVVTATGEKAMLELVNGSLNHSLDHAAADPDATITLTRTALDRVLLNETTLLAEAEGDEIAVEPDVKPLAELLELLDEFKIWFNVVEP